MHVVRWDPTRELSLAPSDVGRLLGRVVEEATSPPADSWNPPMDVAEAGEHFVVTMDVPGLSADDVVIEVHERTLRISGERRQERADEHASYLRIERGYGSFARALTLPKAVDADAITASFEHGVLEVRIPKPVPVKPRRIEIGAPAANEVEDSTSSATSEEQVAVGA